MGDVATDDPAATGDGFVSSGNPEEDAMRRELQDLQLQMNTTTDEVSVFMFYRYRWRL